MRKILCMFILLCSILNAQSVVRIIYYVKDYLTHGWNSNLLDSLQIDRGISDYVIVDTINADSTYTRTAVVNEDLYVNDNVYVDDSVKTDFLVPEDSSYVKSNYMLIDSLGAVKLKGTVNGNDNNITSVNKISGDTVDFTYATLDSVTNEIYFKDTIASNIISKGSVYGKYVIYNALPTSQLTCASGSSSATYFNFVGSMTDSIVIDSMKCVFVTDHNDVYMDSIVIYQGYRNDGLKIGTADIVYCNVTDYGAGNTDTLQVTYSGINKTLSTTWKPRARIVGATSGAAGFVECYTGILYCHYK